MIIDIARRSVIQSTASSNSLEAIMQSYRGFGPTAAGVSYSPERAMALSTVFACQSLAAGTIAGMPAHLYRKVDGGRERYRAHPLYRALTVRPAPSMSAPVLISRWVHHMMGWGNAYGELRFRAMSRQAAGIDLLLPDRTKPIVKGEEKWLETTKDSPGGGSEVVELPPGTFVHIPGFGFDGVRGYAILKMFRELMATGLAREQFTARFFGAGTHPSMVLGSDQVLSDKARDNLRAGVEAFHGGVERAHRVMVLEQGVKPYPVTMPLKDAQFVESANLTASEICRVMGNTPPHMVGIEVTSGTYSNREQDEARYLKLTIEPMLVAIESELTSVAAADDEMAYVQFLRDGLARADMKSRFEGYSTALTNGWLNRNEVRQRENLNPIEGDGGDAYTVQLNMGTLEQLGASPGLASRDVVVRQVPGGGVEIEMRAMQPVERAVAPAGNEEREARALRSAESRAVARDAMRAVFERAALRFMAREAKAAERMVKKAFSSSSPIDNLRSALEEFWRDYPAAITSELMAVVRALTDMVAASIGRELQRDIPGSSDSSSEAFLAAWVASYAARHVASSRRQIVRVLEGGEQDEALRDVLLNQVRTWSGKRAARFARDEPVRAEGAIARETYRRAGVTKIRWRARGDNCPMCASLDGRVVGVEQNFVQQGETVEGELAGGQKITVNGPISHGPLHRGCDCIQTAEV